MKIGIIGTPSPIRALIKQIISNPEIAESIRDIDDDKTVEYLQQLSDIAKHTEMSEQLSSKSTNKNRQ